MRNKVVGIEIRNEVVLRRTETMICPLGMALVEHKQWQSKIWNISLSVFQPLKHATCLIGVLRIWRNNLKRLNF